MKDETRRACLRVFLFGGLASALLARIACPHSHSPSPFVFEARADVLLLENAIAAFFITYDHYPVPPSTTDSDMARVCLSVLSGDRRVPSDAGLNPRAIVFLDVPPSSLDASGQWLDPWHSPYHVRIRGFGAGLSGVRRIDAEADVAVWSNGKNKANQMGGGDDICSWWPRRSAKSTHP